MKIEIKTGDVLDEHADVLIAMEQFAGALRAALGHDWAPLAHLTLVLRRSEDADAVRNTLQLPES